MVQQMVSVFSIKGFFLPKNTKLFNFLSSSIVMCIGTMTSRINNFYSLKSLSLSPACITVLYTFSL